MFHLWQLKGQKSDKHWNHVFQPLLFRASEIQAIMTLRASDIILERNLEIIKKNMQLLREFMANYSNFFDWVEPKAGTVAFVKFKGPLSSTELGQEMAEAGISMKPAYCFTAGPITQENDLFRIGFGESAMPDALEALKRFVVKHSQTWVDLWQWFEFTCLFKCISVTITQVNFFSTAQGSRTKQKLQPHVSETMQKEGNIHIYYGRFQVNFDFLGKLGCQMEGW